MTTKPGEVYDQAGRLTAATTTGGPSYSYGYDANGNRTTDAAGTHTYNSANQLTDTLPPPATGPTVYDANGNLTASAASTTIAYNSINQTTTVTPPAGGLTLGYAGESQDERTTAGATTSTNGLLGVQTDTTTASAATYYERNPQGTLVSEVTPSGEYYYAFDGQNSVIALIDTAGTQRAAYTYDPYGSNATVTALNGVLPANSWRYTSGSLDPSGLYHYGARYYDPAVGRWTQQDPVAVLADPANGNRYAYTGDDPANLTDLSGLGFCLFGHNHNGSCRGSKTVHSVAHAIASDPRVSCAIGGLITGLAITAGVAFAPLTGGASALASVAGAEFAAGLTAACFKLTTGSTV